MSLNLGVVHWAFPPVIGGVEMHLVTVCPEMVRQGAQISLLVGSVPGTLEREIVESMLVERSDGMKLSKIDQAKAQGRDIYQESLRMFESFLDDHGIQVVQAHNLHYDYFDLSKALQDACQPRRIPIYLVLHNNIFIDRVESTTLKIVGNLGWHKLVAISHFLKESMTSKLPQIPQERWKVIMHGIDLEKFHPPDAEEKQRLMREYGFEGRQVILHPGRFLPWKGILPALKSLPQVIEKFPQALMVLTGQAERLYEDREELARYDEAIVRFIEENDLGENVHIGDYDRHDIPRLNALADVVIYTTIGDEPFGLVPVEGMACAVPVIVTRSGGLVESVVDGETGFIISKEEDKIPDQLADRILQLFQNPDLAQEFGQKGRTRAEQKFDKARMAGDYLELSRKLVA